MNDNKNFKHWISICADNHSTTARRIDLFECMCHLQLPQYASETKDDSMLIFQGYKDVNGEYPRREGELELFSTIFIDCDNPQRDPNILERWREAMKNYDYLVYETASSTKERPKFRAVVPMDSVLKWDKNAKAAIFNMFHEFADEKASWFYAPTKDKLDTIEDHITGRWFPSESILKSAIEIQRMEKMREQRALLDHMKWKLRHPDEEQNPDGWRNFETVKHCLGGLAKGERDKSINAACYAMRKHGYKESIPEFLDELCVPQEFKMKFKRQYR